MTSGTGAPSWTEDYLRARDREGRRDPDEVVRALPATPPGHPLATEWRLRADAAARLLRHLRGRRAQRIVEIGSGSGWLAAALAGLPGATVVGMEMNDTDLAQARRTFGDRANLRFVAGDATTAPPPLEATDAIVLASVIQYVADLPALLRRLLTWLANDGELHVLDSPIYDPDDVPAARERTARHYAAIGVPAMAAVYRHHTWGAFDGLAVEVRHRPDAPANRAARAIGAARSPFPWLVIRSTAGRSPIAIVHDAFTQRGGGERVAERLAGLFPEAPVITSVRSADALPASLAGRGVRPTRLQRLADAGLPLGAMAPLLPVAFRRVGLPAATRLVLSSSAAFATHIRVPPGAFHVAYCHTPPHFLWEPDVYFRGRPALRRLLTPGLAVARRADRSVLRRVDRVIANSAYTAERIARSYGRRAPIIWPPIDVDAFEPGAAESNGRFLVVGRLKRHKRFDLAIAAANRARLPLDVIGAGPEARHLRRLAGPTVRFLGWQPDHAVQRAMASCAGLLVPGIEDFGMTTAEVQAAGRPPIAFARGGSLEIVSDARTGFLFGEQTADALAAAMRRALAEPLDPSALVASARRFDAPRFDAAIRAVVAEILGGC